jgi:hypothetical protein
MQDHWKRAEELFDREVDRTPAERAAGLREECGDDEALIAEVASGAGVFAEWESGGGGGDHSQGAAPVAAVAAGREAIARTARLHAAEYQAQVKKSR